MRSRTVTDVELASAARGANAMSDLLGRLGLTSTPSRRSHLRRRLTGLGVSLDHWESERRTYSRAQLARAVAASSSYAGVLRALDVKQAGGTQAHLARRIRAGGIDTSHCTGQAHLRGTTRRRPTPETVLVLLPAGAHRVRATTLRAALLACGVPHVCACGLPPRWQGRPLTLVVDHVNGEWLDNRLPNLRFLCPNCHAQTATWCREKGP